MDGSDPGNKIPTKHMIRAVRFLAAHVISVYDMFMHATETSTDAHSYSLQNEAFAIS